MGCIQLNLLIWDYWDLIDNSHIRILSNWMHIWRLKILQQVKILLWQVARGCLPTRGNLRQRHVTCEEVCHMCNDGLILFVCLKTGNCKWVEMRVLAKVILMHVCVKICEVVLLMPYVACYSIWNAYFCFKREIKKEIGSVWINVNKIDVFFAFRSTFSVNQHHYVGSILQTDMQRKSGN